MAIQRSAAGEIHRLVDDLSGPDPVAREAAAARLIVIGERAVAHLLDGLKATPSDVGRAAIVRVLEATHDRRGLEAALALLKDPRTEPGVAGAAISLVASVLESDQGTETFDALTAVAVDSTRAEPIRLDAIDALARVPPRVIAPLVERLATDASPAVRARLSGARSRPAAHPDPLAAVEAIAAGGPVDPAGLRRLLGEVESTAPLPTLHRLVETIRVREQQSARSDLDRSEWMSVRGAVHRALAGRASRVALYDLRETFETAAGVLPEDFAAAVGAIGDASCLEPLAGALARAAASRRTKAAWRASLLAAGRAIVRRERLTRRHGAVRRVLDRFPDVAADLLAKPGQ